MIKVNLLVEARAEKVAKQPLISLGAAQLNNYIIIGVIILAGAVIGFRYWKVSSQLSAIRTEIAENQKEYDRLKPIIEQVEAFKKRNEELKRKIGVIENLKANQRGPVRIMDEVSKALPDLTWLTSMTLTGNQVALRGQALNENAVANFISNLTASPFFSEPSLKIMTQDTNGVFTFDLGCTFSYTPRGEAAGAAKPKS
jgi:type IV pilus assembly protein PilN